MEDTNQDAAIIVKSVSKTFRLPHEKMSSIKSAVLNFYKRRSYEQQRVLNNISFEVKKGEFFGIVGRNGSGKSTLLKILAGIYSPNKGTVHVNGILTPFIELGVGFNPELTGRENVFLNGALLGFSRKEMKEMYDDIVEFAELERFMDQKLKNYSSGMQVRLAFSIAIRAKSDVLLIDEVLAVGDAAFQQKCFDVFDRLKKQGTTIVLVTHDMGSVQRFCDRAMMVNAGKVVKIGKPNEVADTYLELNYEKADEASKSQAEKKTAETKTKEQQGRPSIQSVTVSSESKKTSQTFDAEDKLTLTLSYKNSKQRPVHFGLQIFNDAGVYCMGTNTDLAGLKPTTKKSGTISVKLDSELAPGNYYVNAATMNGSATIVHNYKVRAANFRVTKDTRMEGVVALKHEWSNDV